MVAHIAIGIVREASKDAVVVDKNNQPVELKPGSTLLSTHQIKQGNVTVDLPGGGSKEFAPETPVKAAPEPAPEPTPPAEAVEIVKLDEAPSHNEGFDVPISLNFGGPGDVTTGYDTDPLTRLREAEEVEQRLEAIPKPMILRVDDTLLKEEALFDGSNPSSPEEMDMGFIFVDF